MKCEPEVAAVIDISAGAVIFRWSLYSFMPMHYTW